MTHKTFRIIGRVLDQTGQGVEGLRVEAWDKDLNLVWNAETGSDGFFEMKFEESYFKEIFARRPDLFFKIFREDELIPGAKFEIQVQLPTGKIMKGPADAVFWKVASGTTNVTIKLQIPAGSQLFKVLGRVLKPDGRPVVGATVKAFDLSLRDETPLGEALTNEAGRYEITYKAELFLKANKKQPDLDVRAYNQQGDKVAWFLEPPLYNAKQAVTVNLIVGGEAYKRPSEYQQLMDTISPLLQDLELSKLTDKDVNFLGSKTRISSEQIVHIVLASRYAQKTELPPELFYRLFRQNLPTSLPALLAQSADIVRQAMEEAVNANIVTATVTFEQVWERFQELAVDHAFEPLDPVAEGKATLGELLDTVKISVDQQREFLGLYVRHEGSIQAFWQGLEETSLQPHVSNLQFALQLGVLTQNNIPLVQDLKDSSDSLKALASLNLEEWEDKAAKYGIPPDVPGKDQEAKVRNYAHTVLRMVEDAFPTAVIIHKIDQDEEIPGKADLLRFFADSPDFEFGTTQIDKYLNESALAGVEDKQGLIRQLKKMDRLFRVTPRFDRYEAMKVLMENGFNSAQSIAMMGQRSFSTQYAEKLGNYWKAKAIYANAAQMTAMTLAVHAKYSYAFNQPGMYVLPDIAKKMQDIPDWETLFGAFKLCDCEHCKSVLSPSAYLVDLLAFLRNHMLEKDISNSALDVLSDRRRDIKHIQLSCENSNTPIPYVDLVNEILEDAVSYNAEYYQTTGTADELSANPEHFNKSAYNKLSEEIYPWNLPFDLWTEEARTYLDHLGVSRYNLLQTFQKNGENPTPNDLVLASEYLGLTTKEQEIITGSFPSEPWQYWGLKKEDTLSDPTDPGKTISGNWVELLRRVPIFLEKSGLTYKELDELLNTRFINPGRFADPYNPKRDICVQFPDAFCNLEGARIENEDKETLLNEKILKEALKRINRFVRLWRKIGWTARELDIALNVSRKINDPFLLKLWHFHRLYTDLNIPVVNLLSFWGLINTDNYKGQSKSLYDQLFLNKAVLNPEDEIFLLNNQRNELMNPHEQISNHSAGVQAALGMSDADLSYVLAESEVSDVLNLANLSHLYWIVTLSRVLKLSIGEFLSVKKLTGINPFLDPYDPQNLEATLQFAEKVRKIRESGLDIAELEYLLRHVYRESEGIAPTESQIALVLGEIRDGLQKIAKENSIVTDPAGEITAAKLAWLKWDESLIRDIIGTLNNSRDYAADLESLPMTNDKTIEFPEELRDRIHYDAENKKLHFVGLMTNNEKELLLVLSSNNNYSYAIEEGLFKTIKTFMSQRMKAFVLSPFSAELTEFPAGVVIPDELKEKVYYDEDKNELFLIGWMTEAEKATLKDEAPDNTDFCNAIDHLYDAPFNYTPDEENQFLKDDDVSKLIDVPDIPTRFGIILEKLLPYIQNAQSTNLAIQKIADALKLESKAAEQLLTHYVILPADYTSGKKAVEILLSPDFTQSNPNVNLTLSAFPEQFNAYTLLYKIVLIITKLRVTIDDMPLLFQKNPDVWGERGWADLNFLPLFTLEDPSALFSAAEKLFDLFKFRDILLPGKPTLFEIMNMAFNPETHGLDEFLKALSERTGWKLADLQHLTHWFGFALHDFRHVYPLITFMACVKIVKRLGVSAEQLVLWTTSDVSFEQARSIKQAVKAKYDDEQWLAVAKPLRDDLRKKQRSTLVSYLIAYYAFRDKTFKDSNDLYAHFLIDPEMDPCMMTSRLKLATSTVQLFVQRCLMNLEEWKTPNASIAQEWSSQWEWMKNYRVWEANRKVFLYPENWIEPELRDDKSPFFKDLENELLQNEITAKNVEKGFLNYLEKLDAVARLEICGMYHEVEKEAPGGIGKNAIDTLHVFGRTRGIPHIYYYRRRIATGGKTMYWTPWERVDLDIEGDHLIPVVWNRRLYLFWPIFTEKAKKESPKNDQTGDQGFEGEENQNESQGSEELPDWEDWGEENNGSVNPRSLPLSSENVEIKEPEKYWEIKMAWSEYKNGKWSAKKVTPEPEIPEKRSTEDIENKWAGGNNWSMHLSQGEFAFKGFVTKKKLIIQCLIHEHKTLFHSGVTMGTYPLFNIDFIGCHGRIIPSDIPAGLEPLSFPHGTDAKGMELIESEHRGEEDNLFIGDKILEKTPGIFHLLFPHQYYRFNTQDSFFYQDNTRTFFVTPRGRGIGVYDPADPPDIYDPNTSQPDIYDPNTPELEWPNPNKVQPEQIDRLITDYYEFIPEYGHWEDMISPTENMDPPIVDQTYPVGTYYDETVGHGPDYDFFRTRNETETRMLAKSKTSSLLSKHALAAMAYDTLAKSTLEKRYLFETFYHPYVCEFVKYLNRDGIDGLLQRPVQLLNSLDLFEDVYLPTDIVDKPYPYEDVDFESDGSYSLYNWEIFFHAPLMVADRLSKNQRFAEAQKWFHYIFDPTDTSIYDVPQKYWKFRPFFEAAEEEPPETLEDLLTKEKEELEKQVNEWRDNPFKPHLIARMRIMAYQKTVVMKYIDNLIAWGDQLFRRDTIESINEAAQLYILAAEILGKRPEDIPPHTELSVKTFNELKEETLDALSNAMVEEENYLSSPKSAASIITAGDMQMFGPSYYLCSPAAAYARQEDKELLYFCIPKNQKLLSYWDTVANRLFKIRHCMTIEGVVRQLPLFEPPIDPGLLVRAVAAGVDIGSALNDLNAPLPHYRFQYMLQKAIELCTDVRSLGASLLFALEKKDAEELALVRSGHEVQLLKAIKQIKKQQIDETKETKKGLERAKSVSIIRRNYYRDIEKKIEQEKEHLEKLEIAQILQSVGQGTELLAGTLALIPGFTSGTSGSFGSPVITAEFGGKYLSTAVQVASRALSLAADIENYQATRASIEGGHERRWAEWKLHEKLADKEIEQIEKQILAAEIRKAISENDLKNHNMQIENAEEVNIFMKDKFTNQELYNWMVSQISTIYFQSYQMAYDIAKRAEKAFQHELGDYDATFIKFGYWDSLKKGLLSGEKLHYDLKRLETGYLEKNKREHEITKHISLAMLDPVDLIKLKETGECFVNIPEAIFDLDYPGHYMRRIKSVSLTIPCVTGPYTSLNCTMTLLNNSVRIDSSATGEYARDENGDDPRFRDNIGAIQSIATSHGQNDSGVFELNFRDERYLPFEGAGAISQWRIELPQEFRLFDYDTISDVILHLLYTAREGGKALRDTAVNQLQEAVNKIAEDGTILSRLVSARHEFPSEWHQFLHSADSQGTLNFELYKDRFPFMFREKTITINRVGIYLKPKDTIGDSFKLTVDGQDMELKKDQSLGNILCDTISLSREVPNKNDPDAPENAAWTIKAEDDIPEVVNEIEDLFILLYYSIE